MVRNTSGSVGRLTGRCQPLAGKDKSPLQRPLRVDPPHLSTDKTVQYDYDIVYVRAPRFVKGSDGKDHQAQVWPNAAEPENLRAPTDLMLLHPNGSEEILVAGGKGDSYDCHEAKGGQNTRVEFNATVSLV